MTKFEDQESQPEQPPEQTSPREQTTAGDDNGNPGINIKPHSADPHATGTVVDPAQKPRIEMLDDEDERSIWQEIRTWIRDLGIAALICILLIVYVAQPFRVEKTSMEPLLFDGDRILVSKISLVFEPISRGDVVVLWNPRDPNESWIKRVIGLPGEKVQIVDGIVYINGRALDEPYIPEQERYPPKNQFPSRNAQWLTNNYPERMEEFGFVLLEDWETYAGTDVALRVPEGYFFVVGDHRRFSMDSRDSIFPEGESGPGLIPQKYIYGKAIFRYWPLDKMGPVEHPDYPGFAEEK
jgi:signal peptidase I